MGTDRKMDYTIMGSSVNLASRLEGVNKQYGTWTLISQLDLRERRQGFHGAPARPRTRGRHQ